MHAPRSRDKKLPESFRVWSKLSRLLFPRTFYFLIFFISLQISATTGVAVIRTDLRETQYQHHLGSLEMLSGGNGEEMSLRGAPKQAKSKGERGRADTALLLGSTWPLKSYALLGLSHADLACSEWSRGCCSKAPVTQSPFHTKRQPPQGPKGWD